MKMAIFDENDELRKNLDEKKDRAHKSVVWRIRLAKSCIKGQVNQTLADLWLINTIFTCYITR